MELQKLLQERMDAAAVVTTAEYDTFDTKDFYEKLTKYRDGLYNKEGLATGNDATDTDEQTLAPPEDTDAAE
jgi:hypothetical protein